MVRSICVIFVLLAGLAGCDKKCDGTWCVRITNGLEHEGQPASIQLHQAQGFFGGLDIHEVDGRELAPGANTGWIDASEGTSSSCGANEVCYRWRLQAGDAWSEELVCGSAEGTPGCFQEGNDYDLVLR